MSKPFREIEKETFRAQIPPDLVEVVRIEIARSRLNISEYTALALCRAVGIDPGRFGIEAPEPPRRGRRLSASSA